MTKTKNQNLGEIGEKTALKFLRRSGYKILEKNFKRKQGEIDIIGRKKEELVFFEVKTILEREAFYPENQITQKKKNQLVKMAEIYLAENKIPVNTPYQIDIIAIEISRDFKKAKIRHYKNAVEDIR